MDFEGADNTLTLRAPNCGTCQKRFLPAEHKTRLTEDAIKQKAEALAEDVARLIKTKNQQNFTPSSPIHHLKGSQASFSSSSSFVFLLLLLFLLFLLALFFLLRAF